MRRTIVDSGRGFPCRHTLACPCPSSRSWRSAPRPLDGAATSAAEAIAAAAVLTPATGTDLGNFGTGVAVDGDVIAVGAPRALISGVTRPGAVFVYTKPSGGWAQATAESAVLVASLPLSVAGEFGNYVAVSGDVIVVGEPFVRPEDGRRQFARAFVYVKPAGGWAGVLTESAVLRVRGQTGGPAATLFGRNVAITGDTIVVGDRASNAAFVFQKPAAGWTGTVFEQAILVDPVGPGPGHNFGENVSASGRTILVAGFDNIQGSFLTNGFAFVYVRPVSGWHGDQNPAARLSSGIGSLPSAAGFMDIREDTVAIGSSNTSGLGTFVFARPASGWVDATPDAELTAPGIYGVVAVASRSAIYSGGGSVGPGSPPNSAAVSLFRRPAAGWSGTLGPRRTLIFAGTGAKAIDSDGATTAVAVPGTSRR